MSRFGLFLAGIERGRGRHGLHGARIHEHGRQLARRSLWERRWVRVCGALLVLAAVCVAATLEYILHNAEPLLRRRIIETASAQFHVPVELDRVEISLLRGMEVEGWGLRIPYRTGSGLVPAYRPMIAVAHFAFRTTLHGLLHQPTRVSRVRVEGMEIHIPPPADRAWLWAQLQAPDPRASFTDPRLRPRVALLVEELRCRNLKLFLDAARTGSQAGPGAGGKVPLEFDMASLDMQDVGRAQAMPFDAVLTNPKPAGQIHVTGRFGPWDGVAPGGDTPAEPGATPLAGDYTLAHADLGSIRGLAGTLDSNGHFSGVLDRLLVQGVADVPNFALDSSSRPLPLHTRFRALVDGTTGDTTLAPVEARLAASDFTTSGRVVKVRGGGHDIALAVDVPHGRMQDFLQLATRANPPLMNGLLTLHARLHLPPGPERVPLKLGLAGSFSLQGVAFNNPRLQARIDGLSARALGEPALAEATGAAGQASGQGAPRGETQNQIQTAGQGRARSAMSANFALAHGILQVTDIRYAIPGATVLLNGVSSIDGRLFEFRGHVQTEATASAMVGGWKGMLLQPLDRYLQKGAAGVDLPIEVSGTGGEVHFGLAFHGADATPAQMLTDVRGQQQGKQQLATARSEAAAADREDAAAAHAPTLAEAERAHAAAVRHRADALRLAQSAGGRR